MERKATKERPYNPIILERDVVDLTLSEDTLPLRQNSDAFTNSKVIGTNAIHPTVQCQQLCDQFNEMRIYINHFDSDIYQERNSHSWERGVHCSELFRPRQRYVVLLNPMIIILQQHILWPTKALPNIAKSRKSVVKQCRSIIISIETFETKINSILFEINPSNSDISSQNQLNEFQATNDMKQSDNSQCTKHNHFNLLSKAEATSLRTGSLFSRTREWVRTTSPAAPWTGTVTSIVVKL